MTLPIAARCADADKSFFDPVVRRMRCTMLNDVVASSVVVSDDEQEQQQQQDPDPEMQFVREMADLMRLEPLRDPASHLIRVDLDRRKMYEHGIRSVYEIRDATRERLEDRAEVLSSEHSMISCFLLIRFVDVGAMYGRSKLGEDVDPDELRGHEHSAILRMRDVLLDKLYLKGVSRVTRAFVQPVNASEFDARTGEHTVATRKVIETEGSNLAAVVALDVVDPLRARSNDVDEVYRLFGIECAQATLAREMHAVLSFDGCYINARHLDLLVQTMTYLGFPCPVSRHGMRTAGLTTLLRASFEETVDVFSEAAVFADGDVCNASGNRGANVTQNIILGVPPSIGTAAFDVVQQKKITKKAAAKEGEEKEVGTPATTTAANGGAELFIGRRRGQKSEAAPQPPASAEHAKWMANRERRQRRVRRWDPRLNPREALEAAAPYVPGEGFFMDDDYGDYDDINGKGEEELPPASPPAPPPPSSPPMLPSSPPIHMEPGDFAFDHVGDAAPEPSHLTLPPPRLLALPQLPPPPADPRARVYRPRSPSGGRRRVYAPRSPTSG